MNYFIIDLETTGLPKTKGWNNYYSYTDYDKYNSCRAVEIAWIILDNKFQKVSEHQYIIKPNGFVIPNSNFHTVTEERAQNEGMRFEEILTILYKDLENSGTFLSYNILFDLNILLSEISRLNDQNDLLNKINNMKKECILVMCADYLDINSLKLVDSYKRILGKTLEDAHQALPDTRAACELFIKIKMERMCNKSF